MKRLLAALLAGAAVFTIAFASAAALGVDGNTIQAGVDTDLACDDNGVGANWGLETDDGLVYGVTITDIDPSCASAPDTKLWVQVQLSSGGPLTPAGVVIDSSSEHFSFTPTPAENIVGLKVFIEG